MGYHIIPWDNSLSLSDIQSFRRIPLSLLKKIAAIQKPKTNTSQNSNKARSRSKLNLPRPSRSVILLSLHIYCNNHCEKTTDVSLTINFKNEPILTYI